jgi:DnaJ-class molecular chaperone
MAQQDYYQALGVSREADADEIRKAYRRLARKHHPDLNPGDKASEDRFKKVQEAYDILSDAKKKQMYDQYGFYSENGAPAPGAGARGPNMGFGGFDFSDVFSRGTTGKRGAGTASGAGGGADFQDILTSGSARLPRNRSRRRRATISNTAEYRFLAGHQGHASALEYHAPGVVRHLLGHGDQERRQYGLSRVQRQRQRDAGRGSDALQLVLPALQRVGPVEESLRNLPGRRPHFDS